MTSLAGGRSPAFAAWATSAFRNLTHGQSLRFCLAFLIATASDSTPVTAPSAPTSGATAPANSPAPQYRSRTVSPGRGARAWTTASLSVSAAAGCTCQNPSALTCQRRPAACSARYGRPSTRGRRGRGARPPSSVGVLCPGRPPAAAAPVIALTAFDVLLFPALNDGHREVLRARCA